MAIKVEKTSKSPKVFGNSTGVAVNSELYTQIVALREDKKMSHAKIAKELNISKSAARNTPKPMKKLVLFIVKFKNRRWHP